MELKPMIRQELVSFAVASIENRMLNQQRLAKVEAAAPTKAKKGEPVGH